MARKAIGIKEGSTDVAPREIGGHRIDGDLAQRIEAARLTLGEVGGDDAAAIAQAQARAAEEYVSDIEFRARRKVNAAAEAKEKEAEAAAKAEKLRNRLVTNILPVEEGVVHTAIIVAALRRITTNDLVLEAFEGFLADPSSRPQNFVKWQKNHPNLLFKAAKPAWMLEDFRKVAAESGVNKLTAQDIMIPVFTKHVEAEAGRLRGEHGSGFALVQEHHMLIRQTARESHNYPNAQSVKAAGVTAEAVRRYNAAVGPTADKFRCSQHQVVYVERQADTQRDGALARRAEQQRREDADRMASEKRKAEAEKLSALLG